MSEQFLNNGLRKLKIQLMNTSTVIEKWQEKEIYKVYSPVLLQKNSGSGITLRFRIRCSIYLLVDEVVARRLCSTDCS
jgi:ribosomal protein S3AE